MDEHYEFDAPSHVLDFQSLDTEEADNADHWFDQCGEGGALHHATPLRNGLSFGGAAPKSGLPQMIVAPLVVVSSSADAPSTSSVPATNIVTSWGSSGPVQVAAKPARAPPAQPLRVSKRKMKGVPQPEKNATVENAPPSKKQRRSASSSQLVRRRSGGRRSGARTSGRLEAVKARAAAAAANNTKQKSSEQQELERMKSLHKEVADQRRRNEASYKAAMAGSQLPKKLVLSTTVPKEFHFSTDGRVKAGPAVDVHKPMDKHTAVMTPMVSKRKVKGVPQPEKNATVENAPPSKKQRRSTSSSQLVRRRSGGRRSGARTSGRLEAVKARAAAANNTKQKSSEQQELERMSLHKEVADQRRRTAASYKAAMAGSQLPKKLVLSTTVPKEFHFSTDGRVKAGPAVDVHKPMDKHTAVMTPMVSKRKMKGVPQPEKNATVENAPPSKKQRRSASSSQLVRRRSGGRRSGARTSGRLEAVKARAAAAAANNTKQKSSEQQELERMSLHKEVADQRRRNEASYKAAMAGSQLPKKLVLSTTVPKEFHFSTDGRVKAGPAVDVHKPMDFNAQLRKHPISPMKVSKGTTVPKPFNLSTGGKRRADEAAYVPYAQQIEQFHRRTPDRYHLRSQQSQDKGPSPVKLEQLRNTIPHTPQLMTRQRARSTLVKSSAELEDEELQKQQQFKFKALELNRKILEAALNPKKPAVKEPTQPEGFYLQMEKRAQARQANKKPEEPEEQFTFHSRPVPLRILDEVVGVPEKKLANPTVPESPAFALKKRVRIERKVEAVKVFTPMKAHAAPLYGVPFQPRLQEKNQVEVCPFSFDERERERKVLKDKRMDDLRNEEVPTFKAQPLPDFSEVVLPEKKVAEPTKPEPFRLMADERGAVKNDRMELKMKEEQKRQAEAASFKARPNTVTHKEPFLPRKTRRSALEDINNSTVLEGFQLSTERRAKERQEFEQWLCEREALNACMDEARRRETEQRQNEETALLRQEQVHKAQPVRHYKPVVLKKSEVSLTMPLTPNFSDRFRM